MIDAAINQCAPKSSAHPQKLKRSTEESPQSLKKASLPMHFKVLYVLGVYSKTAGFSDVRKLYEEFVKDSPARKYSQFSAVKQTMTKMYLGLILICALVFLWGCLIIC